MSNETQHANVPTQPRLVIVLDDGQLSMMLADQPVDVIVVDTDRYDTPFYSQAATYVDEQRVAAAFADAAPTVPDSASPISRTQSRANVTSSHRPVDRSRCV